MSGAGGQVLTEPFDVFDAGRMSVIADPAGTVFMIWQAKESVGAELVNEPGALIWNELLTRDSSASLPFYQELFGWTTSEFPMGDGPPYILLHRPEGEPTMENVIGGMVETFPPDMEPQWNAYIGVDDADAACSSVQEAGGQVVVRPTDMPWGRMAVVRDPFGASLTLLKPPEGAGG